MARQRTRKRHGEPGDEEETYLHGIVLPLNIVLHTLSPLSMAQLAPQQQRSSIRGRVQARYNPQTPRTVGGHAYLVASSHTRACAEHARTDGASSGSRMRCTISLVLRVACISEGPNGRTGQCWRHVPQTAGGYVPCVLRQGPAELEMRQGGPHAAQKSFGAIRTRV